MIRQQNAEQGLIITQAYIENIARQNAGVNHYQVDMMPYIRVDVKEEKARVSVYMDSYEVTVNRAADGQVPSPVCSPRLLLVRRMMTRW